MEHDTKLDLEKELDEIDKRIIERSKTIGQLKCRRYELLAELDDLTIQDAVECAIENDISPKHLLDLIIAETKNKP